MAKNKPHEIMCPHCTDLVPVPDELGKHPNAIVAICHAKNQHCGVKQWASAATRVDVGTIRLGDGKTMAAHTLQLDPPLDEEQERATAEEHAQ